MHKVIHIYSWNLGFPRVSTFPTYGQVLRRYLFCHIWSFRVRRKWLWR